MTYVIIQSVSKISLQSPRGTRLVREIFETIGMRINASLFEDKFRKNFLYAKGTHENEPRFFSLPQDRGAGLKAGGLISLVSGTFKHWLSRENGLVFNLYQEVDF